MSQNKSWLTSSVLLIFDALAIYIIFRIATIFCSALSPVLQLPPFLWEASAPVAQLGLFFIIGMFILQGLYPGCGNSKPGAKSAAKNCSGRKGQELGCIPLDKGSPVERL